MTRSVLRTCNVLAHPDEGDAGFVHSLWYWHSSDPWAVHVTYGEPGIAIAEWNYSREMLAKGLLGAVSEDGGDVRMYPLSAWLYICMRNDNGTSLVRVPRYVVREMLTETFKSIPLGEEMDHIDFDAEIVRLLDAR